MRKALLFLAIISVGLVFLVRLFYLQVYQNNNNKQLEDTAIQKVYHYPKRGYIYDRNGRLLVANQPSYDLMVIPREVAFESERSLAEFCKLVNITEDVYRTKLNRAKRYSPRLPSPFLTQLSKTDYAALQEKLRKYIGFYIQKRSLRLYNTTIGANVLGDIGEVNQNNINNDNYYKLGDLIGKQGAELSYEKTLRGKKGVKYIQKDRFNRTIGAYKEGIYDTLPQPGKNITLTIDHDLQAYGELLMKHKRGGIIALDPSNGEILAMVSGPSYNPNILVGRNRSKNYTKLHRDTIAKPLFDRSLLADYIPGSPFKLINALVALQEEVITPKDKITCYHGLKYGKNRFMGCHCYSGTKNNMIRGIQESCNAYFGTIYQRILNKEQNASKGIDNWSKHVKSFGLGNFLNNDLSVGRKGRVPDRAYYKNTYPNNFYATYTISNAIGQGEVSTTPIQLANMTAAIANRGFYYTPHIIKHIEGDTIPSRFKIPKHTTINPVHFEPVIQGMHQVYKYGTAKDLQVKDLKICGKTGTVENFAIVEGKRTQLTDHSVFVAFAPMENPKIAIAVFVENGYWGSRFAGKMASLMIEKHLKGHITRTDLERWIFTHSLENEYAKPYAGVPFKINGETELQIIENYAINPQANNNEP